MPNAGSLKRLLPRRLQRRAMKGVAAVEFALVLVPLLLIAFGSVEYGRAVYQYNTLVKAVRGAVRILSAVSPDDPGYATRVTQAKCLAVYGNEGCTGSPLAPSLGVADIKVCDRNSWGECTGTTQADFKDVPTGEGPIQLVMVRISGYEFAFLGLPLVIPSATVTFSDIQAVMRQLL